MNENKRKRYPADRVKLHALLDKKEKEFAMLQEEVEELRSLVRQADFAAINATAEMYNVTPEQFARIMASLREDRAQAVPPLPEDIDAALPEDDLLVLPEEEVDPFDDENA